MTTNQIKALPITGQTFKQLIERTWKPQEHIISPWLREGESGLIWAATGVGKTQLSLTLALLAAGGGTVAGWSNDKPRKVLIIDGEMRLADLKDRLVGLGVGIEGYDQKAALENIEVRARQDQKPGVEFYDVSVEADQDAISAYLRKKGIDLLILDNITTLTDSIKDENGAADVKPLLKFLLKMKRDGVTTIVLHHANKGGSSYRGSTGIATTFEVIIGLQRPKTTAHDKTEFTLAFEKFRGKRDESLATRLFKLEASQWIVVDDSDSDAARLIQAITSCEFKTQKDAGDYLGFKPDKVTKLLNAAVANDLITRQRIKDCLAAAASQEFSMEEDLSV
jgi:KaiC/GvpD/RAD55 family RecA-like ATPase